nr:hypothetical protein [Acidipropionibacterium jensenii]
MSTTVIRAAPHQSILPSMSPTSWRGIVTPIANVFGCSLAPRTTKVIWKDPQAIPCRTRAPSGTGRFGENRATTLPMAAMVRTIISIRRRPRKSDQRVATTPATDPARENRELTWAIWVVEAEKVRAMSGRVGATIVALS